MNILFTSYRGLEAGGAQVSTYLLAKELKKAGHNVIIASTGNFPGIKTYNIKKFSKRFFFLHKNYMASFFSKIIEKEKIDIVQVQELSVFEGSWIAARKNFVPLVVQFKWFWFACPNENCFIDNTMCKECGYIKLLKCRRNQIFYPYKALKWSVIKKMQPLLNSADAKLAYPALFEQLEKCGIKNAHEFWVPIDLKSMRADKKKARQIEKRLNIKHPVILFIGRMDYTKGALQLLKSISLKDSLKKITILMVGEGPEKEKCEKFADKNNINAIFVGEVNPKNVPSYYSIADIVVFPSLWHEPFGRISLEAMAAGKPVIGSKVGGIQYVIEDGKTGFLVDPFDKEKWTEKIELLVKDKKLREKMGKDGLKKVKKEYSIEKLTKKTIKIYKKAIKEHKTN